MFRYTKNILLAVATISTAKATQGPGLAISLTENGANQAKNVAMPFIFQFLQDVTVPDVSFDGGQLTNIHLQVAEPALDAVNIKFDNANNGAELTCSQATAHATADFKFKYLFITATGSADIKINKLQLDTELDATTQVGNPAPELAPMLKVQKLDININPNDIDITLSGGFVAKIANVFIPLLKSTVIPDVIKQAQ